MKLELTDAQEKQVALNWISAQHKSLDGAKDVIDALFVNAHFATWSWLDLLKYGVHICSKQYAIKAKDILEMLK